MPRLFSRRAKNGNITSWRRKEVVMMGSIVASSVYVFLINTLLLPLPMDLTDDQVKSMMNLFVAGTLPGNGNGNDGLPTIDRKLSQNPLTDMLQAAGVDFNSDITKNLPTWDEFVKLYGDKPQIIGLETCPKFQQDVPVTEAYIGPAGMFNTGTNLLAKLLQQHCVLSDRSKDMSESSFGSTRKANKKSGMLFQVPWGKHNPIEWRTNNVAPDSAPGDGGDGVIQENVLPVVMIKDPYHWMGSMCRHPYDARWSHVRKHCPNLVGTDHDFLVRRKNVHVDRRRNVHVDRIRKDKQLRRWHDHRFGGGKREFTPEDSSKRQFTGYIFGNRRQRENIQDGRRKLNDILLKSGRDDTVKVTLKYGDKQRYKYDSLADLWSTWFGDYLHIQDYPRLMVRYEDLLIYPSEIITKVCHCAGGTIINADGGISQMKDTAKPFHHQPVGLVEAITKYGKEDTRTDTMTKDDLEYARSALSSELMDAFHYSHPAVETYPDDFNDSKLERSKIRFKN